VGARRSRGAVSGTVLLGLVVLAAFVGIMALIYTYLKPPPPSRAGAMRQVFVAWFTYVADADAPPPNLMAIRNRLPADEALISADDPFAQANGPYPIEPYRPDRLIESPFRISFGYLGNFRDVDGVTWDAKTWDDPKIGLLADGWQGATAASGFKASIPGPILRVHMDGSAATYPRTDGKTDMSSPSALFFDRPASRTP